MNIGGVEKSLLSLLDTISPEKYEVTILTLHKKGGFLEFLPEWVKTEEVNWFNRIQPILMQSPYQTVKNYIDNKQWLKAISFIISCQLSKYLRDRSIYYKHILKSIPKCKGYYDVAIAYPGPTEIIDCYIIHKVQAKKKVQWIHFDLAQIRPNQKLYEKLFKQFDKVFVVSNEGREKLLETYKVDTDKVEVFPNIISKELIQTMADEPVAFDQAFAGVKIVTVGRLSKEKGQDLAIEVLARLKKEGYLVRWYCVGDGNAKGEYVELIKKYHLEEDFILLGVTPNPYPYMKKADIYVQTSRHEGFCITLAEAKCLCKTIITTNFTGAKEQIRNGHNGIIADISTEGLYQHIKRVLDTGVETK
ncbi:MAG: glycosyltransferase [Cellulosilyticaceae bacterium]